MIDNPNRVMEIDAGETGDADPRESGVNQVRSLMRGLSMLSCFDIDHPEWGIVELAKQTGLHKATAHRLVRTLESAGFLTINPRTGKYHLGPSLLKISYLATSQDELVRTAYPYMEKLSTATGESIDLTVWTGEGALFVAQVMTSMPFKPVSQVGRMVPGFANAHGKLFLAFMSDEERAKALMRPQPAFTPYTITDPKRLAFEASRVASEGVSYSFHEQTVGICGVAAPIRDFTGAVRAGISIVAPEANFGPAQLPRYVQALKETAAQISFDLGYRPGSDQAGQVRSAQD